MVNFKELTRRMLANLTPEERAAREEFSALKKEHTYYETLTILDNNGRDEEREICLYRRVWREADGIKLGPKIVLSFGGYSEYEFSKDFIRRVGRKMQNADDSVRGLCIDGGANTYVRPKEVMRIFEGCVGALLEREIEIIEKY